MRDLLLYDRCAIYMSKLVCTSFQIRGDETRTNRSEVSAQFLGGTTLEGATGKFYLESKKLDVSLSSPAV